MRFPDRVLDCVVYLGARTDRGAEYGGTAFYVSFPSDDTNRHFIYLVTAKHNLERAVLHARDAKILIRPTWADDRKSDPIETTRAQWVEHEDADVAILDFDVAGLRYAGIGSEMLLTDTKIQENHIGVGDELQMTGLFSGRRGTHKNVPIVRSGIIAAMPDPDELVDTELGPVAAYLAEVRSLGGMSGSPVFVVLPPLRMKANVPTGQFVTYLLGLVSGHWDQKVPDGEYVRAAEAEKINQGIAVVVPAGRIIELIDSPAERRNRQAQWSAADARSTR